MDERPMTYRVISEMLEDGTRLDDGHVVVRSGIESRRRADSLSVGIAMNRGQAMYERERCYRCGVEISEAGKTSAHERACEEAAVVRLDRHPDDDLTDGRVGRFVIEYGSRVVRREEIRQRDAAGALQVAEDRARQLARDGERTGFTVYRSVGERCGGIGHHKVYMQGKIEPRRVTIGYDARNALR